MTQTYTLRRSAEQWHSIIKRWQLSGQSAAQFCKEQALGYVSFCQWRKRLMQTKARVTDSPSSTMPPSFIDLASLGSSGSSGWQIVLSLGKGVELKLSQN